MRPLRDFLEPLLAGKPLETGPASALAAAIWVLRLRLDDLRAEVWKKDDAEQYESIFQRQEQLKEDIKALEALHARAEGRRPFETRPGQTPPAPGPGYGER